MGNEPGVCMRVENNGVGIEYRVVGEGRPVVLLHGFPDTGACGATRSPRSPTPAFR